MASLTTLHYDGINPVFAGSDLGNVLTYASTGAVFVERSAAVPQATGFLETASTKDGFGLPHLFYPSPQGLGIFERARNSELTGVAQMPFIEEPNIADVDNDQDRDLVGIQPPSTVGIRRSTDGDPYSKNRTVVPDITSDLVRLSVGDVNSDSLNAPLICAENRIVWVQGLSPETRVDVDDNLFPDSWEANLSEADAALDDTKLLRFYGLNCELPTAARIETSNFMEVTFSRRIEDNRLRYTVETSNELIQRTPAWKSD